MNSKFPKEIEKEMGAPLSPRNKFQRKPDNLRTRLKEDRQKRETSRGVQFNGFYSPKRQKEETCLAYYNEPTHANSDNIKRLVNHRSLSHFNKPEFSKVPATEQNQLKNKQNSMSASSGRSSNERHKSRTQLESKALIYQNTRLKAQNKSLFQENKYLKNQIANLSQSVSKRRNESYSKSMAVQQSQAQIEWLTQQVQSLQIQLKAMKLKSIQIQLLNQSKLYLETLIRTLESVNKEQKQEISKQYKEIKYLEIELRTLKKQKDDLASNKPSLYQYNILEDDNRRLRKMISDLQSRLKSSLMFDLTPQPSQKSESFLLDQH